MHVAAHVSWKRMTAHKVAFSAAVGVVSTPAAIKFISRWHFSLSSTVRSAFAWRSLVHLHWRRTAKNHAFARCVVGAISRRLQCDSVALNGFIREREGVGASMWLRPISPEPSRTLNVCVCSFFLLQVFFSCNVTRTNFLFLRRYRRQSKRKLSWFFVFACD